jgi:hypothetical protein
MPTLPDVSTQPSFFPSQAVIENGEIVGYSPAWTVYHRDTLTPMGQAPTRDEALELADAAIAKMAELRAPAPVVTELDPPLVIAEAGDVLGPGPAGPGPTETSNWRHRYSIRANPGAKVGDMVTVSFRVPSNVKAALEERATKLKELGDPGIENVTDALQDATVCWLLMEGVI